MDRQKVSKLLEKMNRLFQGLDQNPDPIERDLMLNYLRQLYDEFYFTRQEKSWEPKRPARSPEPLSRPQSEPRAVEIPEDKRPNPTPPPPPPPAPKVEPTQHVPATRSPVSPGISKYEALFKVEKSNDLAQKLGASPVSTLFQAFTINDRLLYTNELFSKNQQAFQQSLQLLDRYEHFDEARAYLSELAEEYGWMAEEKLDLAKDFVQTVRRRYSA